LTGSILAFEPLENLSSLLLYENSFSSTIPTGLFSNPAKPIYADFGHNHFTGKLPTVFSERASNTSKFDVCNELKVWVIALLSIMSKHTTFFQPQAICQLCRMILMPILSMLWRVKRSLSYSPIAAAVPVATFAAAKTPLMKMIAPAILILIFTDWLGWNVEYGGFTALTIIMTPCHRTKCQQCLTYPGMKYITVFWWFMHCSRSSEPQNAGRALYWSRVWPLLA